MKDPALKDEFIELRAQGMSFALIAERLDVAKSTLIAWSKEAENDISNLRQIYAEAMREKYRMGAERRVKLFAKQLDLMETEIAKRDLSSIPTERLFDITAKISREIQALDIPITFRRKIEGSQPDPDLFCHMLEWRA